MQDHVADYRIHTHASYASCETADFFRVSKAYTNRLIADKDAQYAAMDSFFHLPEDSRWEACPRKPMQVLDDAMGFWHGAWSFSTTGLCQKSFTGS